jgi:hypothetical protein
MENVARRQLFAGATREVLQLVAEIHPRVPRRFPYRYGQLRQGRIGESARRDGDPIRSCIEIPIHRRAAVRAEVKAHLAPLLALANINLARPFGPDLLLEHFRVVTPSGLIPEFPDTIRREIPVEGHPPDFEVIDDILDKRVVDRARQPARGVRLLR